MPHRGPPPPPCMLARPLLRLARAAPRAARPLAPRPRPPRRVPMAAATAAAGARSRPDPIVQYVVIRRDLADAEGTPWPLGAVVAQGAHASVAAVAQGLDAGDEATNGTRARAPSCAHTHSRTRSAAPPLPSPIRLPSLTPRCNRLCYACTWDPLSHTRPSTHRVRVRRGARIDDEVRARHRRRAGAAQAQREAAREGHQGARHRRALARPLPLPRPPPPYHR